MIERIAEVDEVCNLYAYEAARTGRVGEGLVLVGGSYERRIATVLLLPLHRIIDNVLNVRC